MIQPCGQGCAQLTPEKGLRPPLALKGSQGSGGWDPLHHHHAPRTRTGHELCPRAKNLKPSARKGRGRLRKSQPGQADLGLSAPCQCPRRWEDARPGPPLARSFRARSALEYRTLSSADADSGSSGRHRVASCTSMSSVPQRRLSRPPLPLQPTRLPHRGPRLQSPAAAQTVGSCSLRRLAWGRGRQLPGGPALDAKCLGLGGGSTGPRRPFALRMRLVRLQTD